MPDGIDRRTTKGKEQYALLLEEADLKCAQLISADDYKTVMNIMQSCRSHPMSKHLFSDGIAEQSVFWEDAETGVLCKARPDWLLGGANPAILDLKSTEDASPDGFMRSAYTYRYHVQAAWYLDGLEAATGQKPDVFMFLAVEKKYPHAVAFYYADDAMLSVGRAEYRKALRTYAECMKTNVWPGYEGKLRPLSLPRWADVPQESAA
jgi:exodeoxyribonuclease VIII